MKKGEAATKYTSVKGFEHLMEGYKAETTGEENKKEVSDDEVLKPVEELQPPEGMPSRSELVQYFSSAFGLP